MLTFTHHHPRIKEILTYKTRAACLRPIINLNAKCPCPPPPVCVTHSVRIMCLSPSVYMLSVWRLYKCVFCNNWFVFVSVRVCVWWYIVVAWLWRTDGTSASTGDDQNTRTSVISGLWSCRHVTGHGMTMSWSYSCHVITCHVKGHVFN